MIKQMVAFHLRRILQNTENIGHATKWHLCLDLWQTNLQHDVMIRHLRRGPLLCGHLQVHN
jgi:hypothetical protein